MSTEMISSERKALKSPGSGTGIITSSWASCAEFFWVGGKLFLEAVYSLGPSWCTAPRSCLQVGAIHQFHLIRDTRVLKVIGNSLQKSIYFSQKSHPGKWCHRRQCCSYLYVCGFWRDEQAELEGYFFPPPAIKLAIAFLSSIFFFLSR